MSFSVLLVLSTVIKGIASSLYKKVERACIKDLGVFQLFELLTEIKKSLYLTLS